MALLAQAGRSLEDSTYNLETYEAPLQAKKVVYDAHPAGSYPGRLGPWPASDGSTGLSVEGGDFGGGAHII